MFDTYLNPQRTQTQYVTREVHEHRAPTYESVKLLREMEQKAKDEVTKSIRLEPNFMNSNVYMSYDPMGMDKVFNIVFDMNGKTFQSMIKISDDAPFDAQVSKLQRCFSDTIANAVLSDLSLTLTKMLKGQV